MIIAVYFITVFIETFLSFGLSISFHLKVTNTDDFTHILKTKYNLIWDTLLNKQFNMKLRIPNPEMSYSSKVFIASIQNCMTPAIRLNLSV